MGNPNARGLSKGYRLILDVGVSFGSKRRAAAFDQERTMGKGLDKKKEQKKKPAKTLEEKRAAKREKKAARG